MAKTGELYYVHIGSSHSLRRTILESSKMIIECLRRFEKFKSVRAESIKAAEDLMQVIKEINELTGQMKVDVPKIKLPTIKESPAEPVAKKPVEPQDQDELKKLEIAIADIEARLGEIN